MKGVSARNERVMRIELARARAAVERERLKRDACDAVQELSPGRIVSRFLSPLGRGHGPLAWLRNGAALARRYPLLVSAVSAAFSGAGGRRRRWWRLGAALLAGIEAARLFSRPRD
ncbi:MAG TPA: hypothetical protein VFR20_12090 [Burkholderiaceae bacterium]|nr:hypothetical protein [Burkholderiaceae bacterium]